VSKGHSKLKLWLQVAAVILIVFGLAAAGYGYLAFVGKKPLANVDRSDLAAYGNFLQGAVASVWSLAAFLFIFVAFLGQQEELEHSRNQAATQEKTATQQRFENSFFNLLRLHRTILDRVHATRHDNQSVEGSEAFRVLYNALQREWKDLGNGRANGLDKIQTAYASFYRVYESEIGHYFRTLYHIVRFVDQSPMTDKEKYDYEKFLRAQLSSMELQLLFYNGLSTYGYQKFKPLIEKYALLKQVPRPLLLDPKHGNLYEPTAFQDPIRIA
jgi:hypothetical protein